MLCANAKKKSSPLPLERAYTFSQAFTRWQSTIEKLRLSFTFTEATESSFNSYACHLTDDKRDISLLGLGKATEQSSKISACFEALERYTAISPHSQDDIMLLSYVDAFSKFRDNLYLPKIPLQLTTNQEIANQPLAWLRYKNIADPSDFIFIPYVSCTPDYLLNPLTDDKFEYHKIFLQQTSNGVAIGSTYEEALLHSLNEIIERDVVSNFMHAVFIETTPKTIFLLDKNSLPNETQELLQQIELTVKSEIDLIVLPNDLNMPVFIAIIYTEKGITTIKGFGCSLNYQHALERALFEALEQYLHYDTFVKREDENAEYYLKSVPQLYHCFKFDRRSTNNPIELISYDYTASLHLNKMLDAALDEVVGKVTQAGNKIYTCTLYQDENVCTVSGIVTNSNEFFSVIKGVIPYLN